MDDKITAAIKEILNKECALGQRLTLFRWTMHEAAEDVKNRDAVIKELLEGDGEVDRAITQIRIAMRHAVRVAVDRIKGGTCKPPPLPDPEMPPFPSYPCTYVGYVYPNGPTPFTCPVCEGRGKVRAPEAVTCITFITCHACKGTGVIWRDGP